MVMPVPAMPASAVCVKTIRLIVVMEMPAPMMDATLQLAALTPTSLATMGIHALRTIATQPLDALTQRLPAMMPMRVTVMIVLLEFVSILR